MTEAVFACVVLTGSPITVDKNNDIPPATSDDIASLSSVDTISRPTLSIIRRPPEAVPAAIVSEHIKVVCKGTLKHSDPMQSKNMLINF